MDQWNRDFRRDYRGYNTSRYKRTRVEPPSLPTFYVIARGTDALSPGVYTEWSMIKHHVNDDDIENGVVYRKFAIQSDAMNWYNQIARLPSFENHKGLLVQVSAIAHTTGVPDHSAIAIYFGKDNPNNIVYTCLSSITRFEAELLVLEKALIMTPRDGNVKILTSSKKLAYGLNYGMREWPSKEDTNVLSGDTAMWNYLKHLMTHGRKPVVIEYARKKNAASQMVTSSCWKQKIEPKLNPDPRTLFIRLQCRMGLFCLLRMRVVGDIRRLIILQVWRDRARNWSDHELMKEFLSAHKNI